MFNNIYNGKRVFITGHSGFKGSWLTLWLLSLGAKVCGYSLEPNTHPSMFEELRIYGFCNSEYGNILNSAHLEEVMKQFNPDIVFHLAAQPLVRLSYKEPKLTYETNVMGTLNVLEVARKCKSVKAFVNVTTDKCYENNEINRGYKEALASVNFILDFKNSIVSQNDIVLDESGFANVIGAEDYCRNV